MAEAFSLEAFIFVIILFIYIFTSHIIETKRVPYWFIGSIGPLFA